jgi:hypothetical protein
MSAGRTQASNCSAVTKPSFNAASRRVVASRCAASEMRAYFS